MDFPTSSAFYRRKSFYALCAALPVLAILIWQGLTSAGNPDPTRAASGSLSGILDIGVLVFREGLESILVLAALTAGLSRKSGHLSRPILLGGGAGLLLSALTWFAFKGIVVDLTGVLSMLVLQAATGLIAVVVLLIVMNWFFHKIYWGGWIVLHNKKKQELVQPGTVLSASLFWSLILLGASSVYREGFEIVLFLQSYDLKFGDVTVYTGAGIGGVLTGLVALLTFWAHQRLPYRNMLIFTGLMLGAVLLVMVGEEAQEMQQAQWLPTTNLPFLQPYLPDWTGVWFSLFPTWETLLAQGLAGSFVIGSYFLTRWMSRRSAERSQPSVSTFSRA